MEIQDKVSELDTRMALVENYHKELDARMYRHKKDFDERTKSILQALEKMSRLLNGDITTKGLVHRVHNHEEWIKLKDSRMNGYVDVVFKAIVVSGIAYIVSHLSIVPK